MARWIAGNGFAPNAIVWLGGPGHGVLPLGADTSRIRFRSSDGTTVAGPPEGRILREIQQYILTNRLVISHRTP